MHKFFAMDKFDKEMTDTARLNKISFQNGDIQQFVYKCDEMLSLMTTRPSDDHLRKIFGLQLDSNLAKTHEFYVEYLFCYKKPPTDPERTYEGLWKLVKEWIRRKQELKQRNTALKDHVQGIAGTFRPDKGKGTGKDKDGNHQICFAWRNTGVCSKKDAGNCQYDHPKDAKGTGRPSGGKKGGGKGKDGKRSSSQQSRTGKGGAGGGDRSASPRRVTVTDRDKLCKNFLKGKCNLGDKCKYHHNGFCTFHKKGTCNKGDDCVYSHHDPKPAASAVATPKAAAKGPNGGKEKE